MQQISLFEAQTIGSPHNGTETSIQAARAAKPRPDKQRILDLMRDPAWRSTGITQQEAAFELGLERSTTAARFNALEKEVKIRKTNRTRPTTFGRPAAVYTLI